MSCYPIAQQHLCDQFRAAIAEALRAERNREVLEACELLIEQYEASGDFTMGGKLTNRPFSMAVRPSPKRLENRNDR